MHQGAAHQVLFNLDDAPIDIGPVHVYFNDLGDPYDPAASGQRRRPHPCLLPLFTTALRTVRPPTT